LKNETEMYAHAVYTIPRSRGTAAPDTGWVAYDSIGKEVGQRMRGI
jgi:hypothetical protein